MAKRERAAVASTVLEIPRHLVDDTNPPARGNEQERITVMRSPGLPQVELWKAERSLRYWRVFHEEYGFCTPDPGWTGEARWRYRLRELEMNATAQQIFEPGLAHNTYHVAGPAPSFQVLLVHPERVAKALGRIPPHLRPFTDKPELQLALHRACAAISGGLDPQSADIAVTEYIQQLFDELGEHPSKPCALKITDWRFNRVHEIIHDGFEEDLQLDKMADRVRLSPARLVNLFRQCSSLPVHQYVIALRLSKARDLMRQGKRPSDAAVASGFYDLRHLGRVMKQHLGFTPSHYFAAGDRVSAKVCTT